MATTTTTTTTRFCGLDLEHPPGTYEPFAPMELVVECAAEFSPRGARVLDLGTGVGSVALALAARRGDTSVLGVDINETALRAAAWNAFRLGVTNAKFFVGDLYAALEPFSFDVITNTLPYEPPSTYDPECLAEVPRAYADEDKTFAKSLYYAPAYAPMLVLFGLEGFRPTLSMLRYEVLSAVPDEWGGTVFVARQRG